ncbi:MAG: lipopolysaccharide core biosynthesis protein [bacterium ADurb.Bin363]|nr:MAG: lipopolysaccharide core biosynthesis protein [bacterium ADurb.Bin363]
MKSLKIALFRILSLIFRYKKNEKTEEVKDIKSILIIRQDKRIGNILFTTSLIRLVNEEMEVKPDFVVGKRFSEILKNNKRIDKIVEYDQNKMAKNPFKFISFIINLRKKEYDLVIDCKDVFSFNNAILTLLAKGRDKIGYRNEMSNEYMTFSIEFPKNRDECHEVEYISKPFIEFAGKKLKTPDMEYFIEKGKIYNKETEKYLKRTKKIIAIHIGGRGSKTLSVEIIDRIIEEYKGRIIVLYGPDETEKVKKIKTEGAFLIKPESIEELAYYIDMSSLFITPDTGPLHIASALNKNIAAVFLKKIITGMDLKQMQNL